MEQWIMYVYHSEADGTDMYKAGSSRAQAVECVDNLAQAYLCGSILPEDEQLAEFDSLDIDKPFEYTNAAQPFDVIVTGYYKFEVWGAEGGYRSSQSYSGKGGYSAGTIKLNAGDKLYVYTGGQGGATTCSTRHDMTHTN